MPDATLRVKHGERGATAFVTVVVFKSRENRGQLDLGVIDAGIVGNFILSLGTRGRMAGGRVDVPVSLVGAALPLGDGGVAGGERAFFTSGEDAGIGVRGGGGGTGHATGVVI